MKQLWHDPQFRFYAVGAALAFCVSAPATFAMVSPFHQAGELFTAGWWLGGVLSSALVLLLEAGAIGAMIAGRHWLCAGLLCLTFIANYATGNDYWSRAALGAAPTLKAWRDGWLGWAAPILYAASVPALLALFLHYAVARAHELRGAVRTSDEQSALVIAQVQQTSAQQLALVAELVERVHELAAPQRADLALPRQEALPPPQRRYTCAACGQELTQQAHAAAHSHGRGGRCKACRAAGRPDAA